MTSPGIIDRDGNLLTTVGTTTSHPIPIELLQSLYLGRRNSVQTQASTSSTPPTPTSVLREEFIPLRSTITYSSTVTFPSVNKLSSKEKKRILVTGGAGFIGSHLVDRLMLMGHDVVVLDNYFSGNKSSLSHWTGHPNFELVRADVVEPFMIEVDEIYHLACPASPKAYQLNAVKTLKTNFNGTLNMLGLAKRVKAKFLLSSTSEIYGSPTVHPQSEEYFGNVNCIGERACYDEGKRVAEALTYGYSRQDGVDVSIPPFFFFFLLLSHKFSSFFSSLGTSSSNFQLLWTPFK